MPCIIILLLTSAIKAAIVPLKTLDIEKCIIKVTKARFSAETNAIFMWDGFYPDVMFSVPKTSVDINYKTSVDFVKYRKFDAYFLAFHRNASINTSNDRTKNKLTDAEIELKIKKTLTTLHRNVTIDKPDDETKSKLNKAELELEVNETFTTLHRNAIFNKSDDETKNTLTEAEIELEENKTLITLHRNATLNKPDDKTKNKFTKVEIELEINKTLTTLKKIYGWNSRAKFLLIFNGDLETLFKTISKQFIYNVIVLNTEEMNLYTYNPYKHENFNQPNSEPILINSCEKYSPEHDQDFMEKLPKLWRNSTIRVAYMHLYPFIICAECGTGLEVQVVALMQWYFQFDVKYSDTTYTDWGLFVNGSYTGAIGDVYRGTADFVIGHFHLREKERVIDFDTTFSYMDDDICWGVPRANLRSHWDNIMSIFSDNLWISLSVTLVISIVFWYYMSLFSPRETLYGNRFLDSIESIFVNLLGLPLRYEPKSLTMQILFITLWVFFFVVTNLWKAYLINSLTHESYGFQISNLKELIESNLVFGIYTELRDLHGAEGTPEGDYVYKHADPNLCDASHRCLDRTALQKDMATIATLRIFAYLIPQKYRTLTGRDTLYIFKKALAKDYTVQYYTKGHPLFDKINNFLIWFRTSGFMMNIDNQLTHDLALANQKYMATIPILKTKVLGMREMQATFFILLAGLLTGLICFVCECVYYKYCKAHKIIL